MPAIFGAAIAELSLLHRIPTQCITTIKLNRFGKIIADVAATLVAD